MQAFDVAFKAQGIEGVINTGDLPESSIIAALTYGLRRMIQDNVNSEAHKAKQDGDDTFDARAAVDARVGALKDGTVGVRGEGGPKVDSLHKIELELMWAKVVKPRLAKDQIKKVTGLKAVERNDKLQGWWDGLADATREALKEAAKEELERRRNKPQVDVDLDGLTFEV